MSKDELNQYNRLVLQFALALASSLDTKAVNNTAVLFDNAERLALESIKREQSRKADNE